MRTKKRDYRHQEEQDEEAEYERRREDELKKQIKYKEVEIQNLAKASDYLRSKLDQQVTQTQRQQVVNETKYASFGRQVPERDRSPYTGTGSVPLRNNMDSQAEFVPPPHIREHIANLQSDNASLMRRLNLVLQELERVSKEKEEIQNRLQQFSKESMNIQRMINGEDNIDKVNKYMQEDLAYERGRNQKLQISLQEQESYKDELISELRKVDEDQDNQAHQSQNLSSDLQQRLNQMSDLEKEVFYTQEKIKQLNNAIEGGKREELCSHEEKSDLQRIINQLLYERNDLMQKLDNLTSRYDECVREISDDRAEMEKHNKQHSKLVTAKIIFQELESILKNKQKQGFEEIKIYCSFDSKCHQKLQRFAKVLDIIGKHSQRHYLGKWYQYALKPLSTKEQSKCIATQIDHTTICSKMFYTWLRQYQRRIEQYNLKTKAIQHIWLIKIKDSKAEQKRAITIWKGVMHNARQQKLRLKRLIYKQYYNKLSLAMNAWQNHSSNLDTQIRLNVLSQQFAQKQYLNILFQNFKNKSFENKRKRLNVLFHYVKYWKDYLNYKKFLMGAQVSVLHFQKSIDISVIQQCFDALKHNKEVEKYNRVHNELNEAEAPMIDDLSNEIQQVKDSQKLKLSKRAAECLCSMANKSIGVSFYKWKQIMQDFKEAPTTKMRGRITKAYYDKIRMAFNRWKVILQSMNVVTSEMVVEEQQEIQKELTDNVISLQKELKDKNEMRDQSQKKHLHKCVLSFQRRLLSLGLGRWKDKMTSINVKETGAETVVKRLRCRMLRQAFDLYLSGVKYHKMREVEEERCKYFNKTRNERLLNQVLNQWRVYKNNFMKSKSYWYRIFLRLDKNNAQRAFKVWQEVTKIHIEGELQGVQNQLTEQIGELNHQIGEINSVEEVQKANMKSLEGQLTKQAQRVLANRFVKCYYIAETRGFEKWKDFTEYERRKEVLLKRMVDHWRKYKFYHVKSCFQNWMMAADVQERSEQVKKEQGKIEDIERVIDIQNKTFESLQGKLTNELEDIQKQQEQYTQKLQKSIQIIVNKVDKNDYMSQKRYILQQWRTYVKREKFFIQCIQNVIQKSLWTEGFKAIRSHARDHQREETVSIVLNKFRQKFYKRVFLNAFSVWKSGAFKQVFQTLEDTIEETNQKISEHEEKKQKRKDVNANKAGRVMGSQRLRNLFSGWKNVSKHLKEQNQKTLLLQNNIRFYQKKQAVQKWRNRKSKTHVSKIRVQRLSEKFNYLRKKSVFNAIRTLFQNSKDFMARMSNLANIHDHQALKLGYNAIMSFSRAKQFVHNKQKTLSAKDIYGILNNLILRRKTTYLAELKFRTLDTYKQNVYKAYTVLHNISNKMRVYFQRWKDTAERDQLSEEMHNEGPVREQIFEERIVLKNYEDLMREEGYSEEDIKEALNKGVQKQNGLMLKVIRRMQHYNQDLYAKPKMFDRWRQFVHMRKLFKYWLRFASNRGEYIKCDIALAFDRWKKYGTMQQEGLKKLTKKELDHRVLQNAEKLGSLADQIEDKENNLRHLGDQRDELVENYIKGQKLALALWNNNLNRTKHRAFMRWSKNALSLKNAEAGDGLRKNVELIAAIKEKIRALEKENEDYGNENEELRQFSLDGYEIAKNVQQLSAEREKLSVDLADKSQTIRRLLDENEKLNKKLKFAQEEAQSMMKSTGKHMGSSTKSTNNGGMATFQTPMMRNNVY